jgi:hypothetical protein
MHLADVLSQVILPQWLRLGATIATASDMATNRVIEDMTAFAHLLGDGSLLRDKKACRIR